MQYKLTVTCRHKHDSSDFPEDFAVSHHVCQKRPHELVIAGNRRRKVPSVFAKQEQIKFGAASASGRTFARRVWRQTVF